MWVEYLWRPKFVHQNNECEGMYICTIYRERDFKVKKSTFFKIFKKSTFFWRFWKIKST